MRQNDAWIAPGTVPGYDTQSKDFKETKEGMAYNLFQN